MTHAVQPPLVRAASLTHYIDVANALGLAAQRMLADAGLSASALTDPDLMVPAQRVSLLLERSAQVSGVESFGLRMAEARQLSNLGPVGLVIRDQPTLRESLAVLARYHAALNGSLALLVEEEGELVLIREDVIVPGQVGVRQATEMAIGVLLRLMRVVMGAAWLPRRVCFMHGPPRDTRVHHRVLGPQIAFNEDFNGIVCSRRELDTPNPSADPQMARYAQQLLEATLGRSEPPSLLADVRRMALLLLPSGRCSIEQVAGHLGLVPRTVQRRLAERGLSFSEVVNAVRLELAQRHVHHSERPLIEVAALLGFAAPSGFSRWYQQQFGCSPSQGRAQAQAQPPAAPQIKA